MLPVLQLGPLAIQMPALLLLIGLWLGLSMGARFTTLFQVESKKVDDLILLSLLSGLIGARLFYILRFPKAFLDNLSSIFSLNPGLFDFSAGLLVTGVAFLIILQRKKLSFWPVLDAITIPLSVFTIFLGFSHFASGAVYGLPTDLPWGITLWGINRHPTQVYEILLSIAVLWILLRRQIRLKKNDSMRISGIFFLKFISLAAMSWILIDTFRADSDLIFNSIRTGQIISLIVLLISFWLQNQCTLQEERKKNIE